MNRMQWIKALCASCGISMLAVGSAVAKKKGKGKGKGKKSKPKKPTVDQDYKSPDKDKNKKLSASEMEGYFKYPEQEFKQASGGGDSLDKLGYSRLNSKLQVCMFNTMDADKNGRISLDEYKEAHRKALRRKYKSVE